ncbi:hypothetical protein LEN26_014677 [Aphanomyces euteiches]|nr:hypothetical protein LEN26_014677 [Aphanomyces euteiches]KAH9113875.1 hypothetical protein AeMF1_012025 [Aphanomyces euteiches]KAH9184607.1 hypothetical protein AeNC1_013418 [Aphanomyces euteiches]
MPRQELPKPSLCAQLVRVRHGGKRRCDAPNCSRNVRLGNFCSSHGSGIAKKLCIEAGCTNVAHKRQRCVRHGGGRQCKIHGCKTHARSGGYCCRHMRLVKAGVPSPDSVASPSMSCPGKEVAGDNVKTVDELLADFGALTCGKGLFDVPHIELDTILLMEF